MTFEERVEKEVSIRMAKRLLKDDDFENGLFKTGGTTPLMTFEERVEEEVNIRMAKRLLKDEPYESGSFYIEEVKSDNTIRYKNQLSRQPVLSDEITVKMRPITGEKIATGHYIFIKLGD